MDVKKTSLGISSILKCLWLETVAAQLIQNCKFLNANIHSMTSINSSMIFWGRCYCLTKSNRQWISLLYFKKSWSWCGSIFCHEMGVSYERTKLKFMLHFKLISLSPKYFLVKLTFFCCWQPYFFPRKGIDQLLSHTPLSTPFPVTVLGHQDIAKTLFL